MNMPNCKSVKPRELWSSGPAPVFTPMSYPRLHEFSDAHAAYIIVERVTLSFDEDEDVEDDDDDARL